MRLSVPKARTTRRLERIIAHECDTDHGQRPVIRTYARREVAAIAEGRVRGMTRRI
jgi:hypothetical protein